MGSTLGQDLCQVRSETDFPCDRPAAETILGVHFCERCAREQQDYFAVGEATRVSKGESGGTRGVGYAARAPRSGYPAGPRGGLGGASSQKRQGFVALGRGRALGTRSGGLRRDRAGRRGADAAEAKVEGNGTDGAVTRAEDADGAVARGRRGSPYGRRPFALGRRRE